MFLDVIKFVRMPMVLILIVAIIRLSLGPMGVEYTARSNASFSVLMLNIISCIYFGALSKKVGNFSWPKTLLMGLTLGLFTQVLIFSATAISYLADIKNSYFTNWDALNVAPGTVVPMAAALKARVGGLIIGPIFSTILVSIGRVLGFLAPEPKN
ncbi:MAG: hypothetical protein HY819_10530 [Acidobacteria bacterium]|nr:hypothetical protein [Acidobacteriota bacterium]